MSTDPDRCVFCGALGHRNYTGEIVVWSATMLAASPSHDHETLTGET